MPSPLEIQQNAVKSLWQQNVHNAKEISKRLNIPLRSCERYVSKLCKTGNNSINHSPGELKAKLEENDPELEVSERTVRRELKNLGYVSILPRK
ncbi:8603_t:CDS:2, partial [Entrophospora sp. SA101]